MADKVHPGTEKNIDPADIAANTSPEEQGEGDDPIDNPEDFELDESQGDEDSVVFDEDQESSGEDPVKFDLSKYSREQLLRLRDAINEATTLPPSGPSGISDSDAVTADEAHGERAIAMRDYLKTQPRVTFMIPRRENEPPNAVETVIMNGWRFNILKGEYVDLPFPVVEILKTSYSHTMNDNQPYLVANVGNKIDDVTGQPKDPSQLL